MNSFPWREYTKQELIEEFNRLVCKFNNNKDKLENPISLSRIGYKCTNAFFQYERMNTPCMGRPSSIDYWEKQKKNIIKFSRSQNRDLFSTVNYFNHSPSQFPILTACKIYKYFNATSVFDPYAGWGDRCLGAIICNIDYYGIDCNKNLKIPYKNMLNFFDKFYDSNINIKIAKCEDVKISNLDFDIVLTSPPFWKPNGNMNEIYNYSDDNYHTFMSNSLIPIMSSCKKRKIWFCLYIPINMYEDISTIFGKCRKKIHFRTNNRIDTVYCWKFI